MDGLIQIKVNDFSKIIRRHYSATAHCLVDDCFLHLVYKVLHVELPRHVSHTVNHLTWDEDVFSPVGCCVGGVCKVVGCGLHTTSGDADNGDAFGQVFKLTPDSFILNKNSMVYSVFIVWEFFLFPMVFDRHKLLVLFEVDLG